MARIKCFKQTSIGCVLVMETNHKPLAQAWLDRQTEGFIKFPANTEITHSTKTLEN